MAIKQYSLAKDGARQLAPGFKVREFRCRDGSDVVMIDESLVMLLQCIREHFGKPITITSGYRTAAHNAAVGGAKSSQHLLGRAADIQVQGVSVEDVAAYAESLMPGWGGVGRYPVKAGRAKGWVHVDTLGAEELTRMILDLREPYKTPCRLVLLEQHTMAEAARLCGRPEKTVNAQIYRAKKMLVQQIREQQEGRSVHGTV